MQMLIFTLEPSKVSHCHFFLILYINIKPSSFVEKK